MGQIYEYSYKKMYEPADDLYVGWLPEHMGRRIIELPRVTTTEFNIRCFGPRAVEDLREFLMLKSGILNFVVRGSGCSGVLDVDLSVRPLPLAGDIIRFMNKKNKEYEEEKKMTTYNDYLAWDCACTKDLIGKVKCLTQDDKGLKLEAVLTNRAFAPTPKKVIFSGGKTIVIWGDGTKTVVSCMEGDEFDEYSGFCAALAKKLYGSTTRAKKLMNKNKKVDEIKELSESQFEEIKSSLDSAIKALTNSEALMAFAKQIGEIAAKSGITVIDENLDEKDGE